VFVRAKALSPLRSASAVQDIRRMAEDFCYFVSQANKHG
jgi:hypothetical protein